MGGLFAILINGGGSRRGRVVMNELYLETIDEMYYVLC